MNRKRKARDERPPQRTKLRRPASHSCICKVEETFDKLILALIQAVGTGALFGLSFGPIASVLQGLVLRKFSLAQVLAVPNSYLLFVILALGLAALAWSIAMAVLVFRSEDEIRNWRLGARGEQAVAESLADPKLAAAGYQAFNDVPGDGQSNIDHVAVGPGGLAVYS